MLAVKIAPSILAADFTRLGEQVKEAIEGGGQFIHVDVMDGHFVPNLSIGVPVVRALRPIVPEGVLLDVHLMIENPERLIPAFAQAGADILTVHVEAAPDLRRVIRQIRELGVRPGVALNPPTQLEALQDSLSEVHVVNVMSVNPGFGGQAYMPESTAKVARLRQMLDGIGSRAEVEVDGGVYPDNAREIAQAGASVLVAGTAIFNDRASVAENIRAFQQSLG